MKFTYYGHSCFSLLVGGKTLLFDPFISGNELAKEINISEIKADYVFLSHGHSDHIGDAISIAIASDATVVACYEIAVWAGNQGTKYHPMNTGGTWKFDFGIVRCVSAVHSSSLPDGSYGGNPMGFIISGDGKNIYYSGDTALTLDMQLIPRYGKLDLAVLPIGDNFTMGIADAIEAAKMVNVQDVVGVHYDTFGYIKIDHEKAKTDFEMNGITLHLPPIGSKIEV